MRIMTYKEYHVYFASVTSPIFKELMCCILNNLESALGFQSSVHVTYTFVIE